MVRRSISVSAKRTDRRRKTQLTAAESCAVQGFIAVPQASRGARRFTAVRLDFARYLALALEFQLAADVLQTAVTPTLDQLGILAAIATIRTALNFFLSREMKDERTLVGEDSARSS